MCQSAQLDIYITLNFSHLCKSLVTFKNRSVTGTSAQISFKCAEYIPHVRLWVVPQQSVHGHHDAGSTKPTLRPVSFGNPLLF